MKAIHFFSAVWLLCILFFSSPKIVAQSSSDTGFDIEIDPIAYGFNGFSVHGGYLTGAWRFDLGIFGLDLPEWLHGNENFNASFVGAGWKADRFFSGKPDGFFAGAEGGISKMEVVHKAGNTRRNQVSYSLGVRGGYRWSTGLGNLYMTPWLGLDFTLNPKDITIDGDTFESSVFQPFPTIHVGWKF
ncbi:MAG: hypothetical protein WEA56_02525 [Balneolaceae bacterium]